MALFKAMSFWDNAVIRIIKLSREPTKHPSNGKIKLTTAVETCITTSIQSYTHYSLHEYFNRFFPFMDSAKWC